MSEEKAALTALTTNSVKSGSSPGRPSTSFCLSIFLKMAVRIVGWEEDPLCIAAWRADEISFCATMLET